MLWRFGIYRQCLDSLGGIVRDVTKFTRRSERHADNLHVIVARAQMLSRVNLALLKTVHIARRNLIDVELCPRSQGGQKTIHCIGVFQGCRFGFRRLLPLQPFVQPIFRCVIVQRFPGCVLDNL